MNLGKINIITPPDKLFNLNMSYLLIKPSLNVKQQFQTIQSHNIEELKVDEVQIDSNDIKSEEPKVEKKTTKKPAKTKVK